MPAYPYREIVELRSVGLSEKKVAHLCGCSLGKARDVLAAARRLGICWPIPPELGDDELEQLLDPHDPWRKMRPDFDAIAEALGRGPGNLDADAAYAEYCAIAKAAGQPAYARGSFGKMLSGWQEGGGLDVVMRVNWFPGEEIQVDWAGRKLSLANEEGKVTPAFLFVATTPYSDYTFVRASLDMGMQSWLEHHCHMLEFYGGVPLWLAPDNLAQAVTFTKDGREVNRHYRDFADHYGAMVLPARIETPTDKAAVEGHVRIMANRIVGVLESMRFSSIEQLNASIAELLAVYNAKPVQSLGGRSREEVYLAEELPCMQPLPATAYGPCTWKRYRASADGVVAVRGNYYAVPRGHAGEKVRVRIGVDCVEVFDARGRQLLAAHPRREDGSETFEGLPGTCPDRFRPLDDFCRARGRGRLLEQWDAEANGGLTPADVVCRSKKVVHWRCPDCGFAWEEAVVRRTTRGFDDCLACCGVELVEGRNDLAALFPEVAAEWHPIKNPMPPTAVFSDYRQRVWWLGKCGHEWSAPIADRVRSAQGRLCPYCSGKKVLKGFNDVATVCPEMARLWHPSKNRNVRPDMLSVTAAHAVYLWSGPMSRIWRQTPRSWMAEHGYGDRLEPFDGLVTAAVAEDAAADEIATPAEELGRGRQTVKWSRFNKSSGLADMSLQDWCLAFNQEYLLHEWDAERNGGLRPADVSRSYGKDVWWHGDCGHSWQAPVRRRVFDDSGCIYCGRARVLPGYSSLECNEAKLLAMWHPTRNGDLDPATVSDRSHEKIWWQCPKCGYEWQEPPRKTNPKSRVCPACDGHRPRYRVPGRNTVAGVRSVMELWDCNLNVGVEPEDCAPNSKRKIWWRGKCGHVWEQRIDQLVHAKGERCPYCANRKLLRGFNDLATVNPDAAAEWHPERNGDLRPKDVLANSGQEVWWLGKCGHEWSSTVRSRGMQKSGCLYCSGRQVLVGYNDLASQDPELAAEWHPTLNGDVTPAEVTCGASGQKYWWQCGHGHAWQATVNNRHRLRSGCPVCSGRMAIKGVNDLATTHRKLAKQWDRERNGMRATELTAHSSMKAWWVCKEGHDFQMIVSRRALGKDPGCPYCAGRKVLAGYNDLATLRPDLAAQWHPTMNKGLKPTDVMPTSNKEVWWRGECGHTWRAKVCDRNKPKVSHCPYCTGRRKPERPVDLG